MYLEQQKVVGELIKKAKTEYYTNKVLECGPSAFIGSRLDYGDSLLYGLPDTDIQRLQKVQNTAARIVTRTTKYNHISFSLHNLHWRILRNAEWT